jgi:hypothetical protein
MDLLAEGALLCRLTPDRALADLDQATSFVADRGMLTLAPCCSLPSLFGACHEPPYKPGVPGFGSWPATKWWWGGALAHQPGVVRTMVHRGKVLYLSAATAVVVDPLCRDGLAHAERQDDTAGRVLRHLADAGASSVEDIKVEIGVPSKVLAAIRRRLERSGALLALPAVEPAPGGGHVHTSVLRRWDHVVPESPGGRLDDVVVAAVRAAVVAPEAQVRRWLPWPVSTAMIERLITEGRLARTAVGLTGPA